MSEHDDTYEAEDCPTCGAPATDPCRLGPGVTGNGQTSCGDGISNVGDPS